MGFGKIENYFEQRKTDAAKNWNGVSGQKFADGTGIERPNWKLVDDLADLAQPFNQFPVILCNFPARQFHPQSLEFFSYAQRDLSHELAFVFQHAAAKRQQGS